jgi:hypothetical protein
VVERAPAGGAPGHVRARLRIAKVAVRRHRHLVRVGLALAGAGRASGVVVALRDARGHRVALSRRGRIGRGATISLKSRRALRRGRYSLTATARVGALRLTARRGTRLR